MNRPSVRIRHWAPKRGSTSVVVIVYLKGTSGGYFMLEMNASSCTDTRSGMVLAEMEDLEEQFNNLSAGGSNPSCRTI